MRRGSFYPATMGLVPLALTGCIHSLEPASAPMDYAATIEVGRSFVKEVMTDTGAASVSVALVDGRGVIWSEAFGKADKALGHNATPSTRYGACSVSKMIATVAVMQLVDQGKVALDEPVTTYLKTFTMPLDARYKDITVRMLINHSSGLPTDDRRSVTVDADPQYGTRVMEGMKLQRLAHAPGFISAYNNEGFTLVESLVEAVSGQSFPAFVRQQILQPLGMTASQFLDVPLPANGYAKPYAGDTPRTMYAFNMYASGGLFSTPEDLGRLATMLINGGQSQSRRILSEASVRAMATDQRLGSFNPVPNESMRFGLGWDTMASPGFAQLGIAAWQKTGDFPGYYGTNMAVLPEEGLGIVVFGASGSQTLSFGSSHAVKISERILLKALVERGRLKEMPKAASTDPLPVKAVSAAEKATFTGHYASSNGICRVSYAADDSLTLEVFSSEWATVNQGFKLRSDGWYAADGDPITALRLFSRSGSNWLAQRQNGASSHYTMAALMAQSLETRPALSSLWQARLAETYLPVDKALYITYPVKTGDPRFRFQAITGLEGYVVGNKILRDLSPASTQRLDGFFLAVPDAERGLQDAALESHEGQDWLRLGCNLYRPLSTLALLSSGTTTLSIGDDAYAEWRKLPTTGQLAVTGATWWCVYDADFKVQASGSGNGSATLNGSSEPYLVVFAKEGAAIRLEFIP